MSYLSSLWHYGSWEKIFHNFCSLRPIFGPIFGAPALAMTLKLTHDTNAMRQIIVKRDVGRRCKIIKVVHLSDWCEIFVCQPKLHISCLNFTRSSLKLHIICWYRNDMDSTKVLQQKWFSNCWNRRKSFLAKWHLNQHGFLSILYMQKLTSFKMTNNNNFKVRVV